MGGSTPNRPISRSQQGDLLTASGIMTGTLGSYKDLKEPINSGVHHKKLTRRSAQSN